VIAADSLARFEVSASVEERVLRLRMSGIFTEDQMQAFAAAYRLATHEFQGRKHMVIADMRGMKPLHPPVALILADVISFGRSVGVVLCAHVSNHAVQRLQAERLARENSPTDDVTVDVSSVNEAERVVDEARPRLEDERYGISVREALPAPLARPRTGTAP